MNKYNKLLKRISEEYMIDRGRFESEEQWKSRLIYSLLGRMALASLGDMPEEETVSIIHLKQRVETLVEHYKAMYPEVSVLFPVEVNELSDEIYNVYLNSGHIYHEPNRVMMAQKTKAVIDNVSFVRGSEISAKLWMSGLGTYESTSESSMENGLQDMFQLETIPLTARWGTLIQDVKWSEISLEMPTEFLKMSAPFNRGYWVDKPDKSGTISLLRTGLRGSQIYYIYKVDNGSIVAHQLPQWMVEEYNYRSLANACLSFEGLLPATTYRIDGAIVYLRFGYLPPVAELNLWKLYTWPSSLLGLPRDFNRICSFQVFMAIKSIMEKQGYVFVEER